MILDRPCSVLEALETARALVNTGVYWLGTGDKDTQRGGRTDCFGFAFNKCFQVRRHRPGFAKGPSPHPTVNDIDDDTNSNSAIEDARGASDLFELVTTPQPGDLLVYPSLTIVDPDGDDHHIVGHAAIVESVRRMLEWDPMNPVYSVVDIIQCCGPNGRTPGIFRSDGHGFDKHDHDWPKPHHRTHILRVRR